jgi:predicted site-specific integrase-resolvase
MTQTQTQSRLLTVKRFAALLGLSPWTIRHYAYSGRVASVKLGTRLMIPTSEADRLIEENMRPRSVLAPEHSASELAVCAER